MIKPAPNFRRGARVITPPTPGARDAAIRAGGPGCVIGIDEIDEFGNRFITVQLDSTPRADRYNALELTRP